MCLRAFSSMDGLRYKNYKYYSMTRIYTSMYIVRLERKKIKNKLEKHDWVSDCIQTF